MITHHEYLDLILALSYGLLLIHITTQLISLFLKLKWLMILFI